MPIDQAWGTRVENSRAYWYVTSPIQLPPPTLAETMALPENPSDAIRSLSEHLGLASV